MIPIQLLKGDQVIDINQHPSLLALLHAMNRGIESSIAEIDNLEREAIDLKEREKLLLSLGQSVRGVRSRMTRNHNRNSLVRQRLKAYRANNIEVPNPAGFLLNIEDTETDIPWILGQNLPSDTPLDVLHALAHAKDKEIFTEFRIALPDRTSGSNRDPMIYGVAGDACFYVASWR